MKALNRIELAGGGCVLLSCAAMAFASGCAARVYSEPVGVYPAPVEDNGVIYVDTVPANIETYPHYAYSGADAYYVEGRWYRRGPRGWGYYRQEPPELERQRQRTYVVHEAPAPVVVRERPEGDRGPAYQRERPVQQEAPRPPPGVVEAQRRPDEARDRPTEKREPTREQPKGREETRGHEGLQPKGQDRERGH